MIELDEKRIWDRSIVGGKGHYISVLLSLGLRVPRTIVLPASSMGNGDRAAIEWLASFHRDRASWALAVRSSGAVEDSMHESKAGHFLTRLGEFNEESLQEAIEDVRKSGPNMSVLIQPLIDAEFSGVAFSCDPVIYTRSESFVEWTTGLADGLVSGQKQGQGVRISAGGNATSGHWPSERKTLDDLIDRLRFLERRLEAPVDVEWVLDRDGQLWFLQVRPVVLPEPDRIRLDSKAGFDRLPGVVRAHSKIRLRKHAVTCGVQMAPAAVRIMSGKQSNLSESHSEEFRNAAGVSVVLLHPERIDCRIVREFAPLQNLNVDLFTRGCRRYAVRRYPRVSDMTKAETEVLQAGLRVSWVSVAIEQAVWDAYATGIIRRSKDGYIIELAMGHFIPKGVVPTSTIVLSAGKKVLTEVWRNQPTVYHFIDGHVVTETPPSRQLHLKEPDLAKIATVLEPAFEGYEDAALEFGLLENGPDWNVYLIDVAEADKGGISLDAELIGSGVISIGKCKGKLSKACSGSVSAIDGHLNDRIERTSVAASNEKVIVVADRTSVDLLPLIGAPNVVGFVFAEGSVLAHLAVVLREKGIPAVVLHNDVAFASLPCDRVVELDAVTPGLSNAQRIVL
jgi:rifampicin phosphotransferase